MFSQAEVKAAIDSLVSDTYNMLLVLCWPTSTRLKKVLPKTPRGPHSKATPVEASSYNAVQYGFEDLAMVLWVRDYLHINWSFQVRSVSTLLP